MSHISIFVFKYLHDYYLLPINTVICIAIYIIKLLYNDRIVVIRIII